MPGQVYELPANYKTISEQIIEYMQLTLDNADFDPNNPGKQDLFEFVTRGTINDINGANTPGAAIEEGAEKKQDLLWPITDSIFRVFVNFKVPHVTANAFNEVGVDQFAMIRYYFGRIVRLFVTDDSASCMGGLAIDCTEAGNTPEVNGYTDSEPGGTVYFDIHYRHKHGDMFTGV